MKIQDLHRLALEIEKNIESGGFLSSEDHKVFSTALAKSDEAKISELSVRVKAGMSHQQFLCFVVPIERLVKNKITDSEILVETQDIKGPKLSAGHDLILVLDNLRSPFNMGAVVRTCDALGVSSLIATGYSPDLENEKVQKISMGAHKNIKLEKFRDLSAVRQYLNDLGYKMIAIETVPNASYVYNIQLQKKTAFVFGNERFGLAQSDLELCDQILSLPTYGVKNSLNINAAVTACGYEWVRQNGEL